MIKDDDEMVPALLQGGVKMAAFVQDSRRAKNAKKRRNVFLPEFRGEKSRSSYKKIHGNVIYKNPAFI